MVANLKKLISFKTIVGNHKENKRALGWVRDQLQGLPLYLEDHASAGFSSLTVTTQKTKKPALWLAGHMDVAKADSRMFNAVVKKNRLYGRGAFDMKFAIASYIKILKELKNNLSKMDFGLIITTDEEVGGTNGIKFLLDKGYGSQAVFLPDGGEDWKIEKASKGIWSFTVKSYGKSAHPSMPWLAINALEELMDFLQILRSRFQIRSGINSRRAYSTIDINELNTGKTGDILPDYAEAMVDVFLVSEKERERTEAYIKEASKKFKGIKIETNFSKPSLKINLKNQYVRLFSQIAFKKYGIKRETVFTHSSSDAVFFAQKGISVIETRPKGGGHHSENEWIDIADLEKFHLVLKDYVEAVSRD